MFKLGQLRLKILPQLVAIFALIIGVFSPVILANESTKTQLKSPVILLAHIYQRVVDVRQYLVSEKLDGVRAIWYGKVLRRRAGKVIATPIWSTQALPKIPLDGELWQTRGQFDAVSATVRTAEPNNEAWRKISYHIFEFPNTTGTFEARAKHIEEIV